MNKKIMEQEKKKDSIRNLSLFFFYGFCFVIIVFIALQYKKELLDNPLTKWINYQIFENKELSNNNKKNNIVVNEPDSNNGQVENDNNNNSNQGNGAINQNGDEVNNNNNNSSNPNTNNNQNNENPISDPTNNEKKYNIVYKQDTDTLKVWIEEVERTNRTNYYVSHIWVKDAYNQFKSNVPDNFGKVLQYPSQILDSAIVRNDYSHKLIVGTNGGSIILNGKWGQNYYNANVLWNYTSPSPIVMVEGKERRDLSMSVFPEKTVITYGLKRNGYLGYYRYKGGKDLKSYQASNVAVTKKLKEDGVQNTFAFQPVLVYNGKKVNNATAKNIRQGLCQIDKNNFAFITDVFVDKRDGFSFSELADYMLSLGCIAGFNIDGGGSTTLLYKETTGNVINVMGNTRQLGEVIYFHS